MALHSKWSSGDLIFYDGTQDIMTIKDGTDGVEFDVNITMGDGDPINFGASDDIAISWTTGDVFEVLPVAANSDMYLGSTGKPLDIVNYGNITYRDPNTVTTTTGTVTLAITDNRFQFLNTTGARNLLLPSASGGTAVGIQYLIANTATGANTLSVYNGTSGGALIGVIAQYESGILVNDGNVWRGVVGTAT